MSDKNIPDIPNPGEGKRGEQGYIGYLLRQASASTRLAVERALEDLEVTQPQFLVMTLINAYPGSTSADIARLAMLTPQTISVIVANLERTGRLARATDGRAQRIQLSDDGVHLLARCRARTLQIEQLLSASMPPGLESTIRRWLAGVATLDLTIEMTDDR